MQPWNLPTHKSLLASIKFLANFSEITLLYFKKSEKVFGKLTLGNCEFGESEIWHFHPPDKVKIYYYSKSLLTNIKKIF
jgi:hypothetical protein